MRYLLDSNTLIEAKNRYYGIKFCPAYWDFIHKQNLASQVGSITIVQDELKKGNDELADWAKDNKQLFVGIDDEATQKSYISIVNHIAPSSAGMRPGAMDEFLDGADPWLIAKAIVTGATVVTHETYNPSIKKKFLIPNICTDLGVRYITTFEMLEELEAEFILG